MTDAPDALDTMFANVADTIGPTQVAKLMGVTPRTVYSWIKEGTIPAYKIGTSWFVLSSELKTSLRAGRNSAKS